MKIKAILGMTIVSGSLILLISSTYSAAPTETTTEQSVFYSDKEELTTIDAQYEIYIPEQQFYHSSNKLEIEATKAPYLYTENSKETATKKTETEIQDDTIYESNTPIIEEVTPTPTEKPTPVPATKEPEPTVTEEPVYSNNVAEDELRLLSAITYAESGNQCYAGQLAVAIVVINRIEMEAFPNTMTEVIYQPHQFGPAGSGRLNEMLRKYDRGDIPDITIRAATAALNGEKMIEYNGTIIDGSKLCGFNTHLSNAKYRIQDVDFI